MFCRLMGQSAILARLFYHTAEILIWKTHPMDSSCAPAINADLQQHAHSVCGIVAQVKFRYDGTLHLTVKQ